MSKQSKWAAWQSIDSVAKNPQVSTKKEETFVQDTEATVSGQINVNPDGTDDLLLTSEEVEPKVELKKLAKLKKHGN